jgi:hypothetical protein
MKSYSANNKVYAVGEGDRVLILIINLDQSPYLEVASLYDEQSGDAVGGTGDIIYTESIAVLVNYLNAKYHLRSLGYNIDHIEEVTMKNTKTDL